MVRNIVSSAVDKYTDKVCGADPSPVSAPFFEVFAETSARHVHLSADDVEKLFGAGHTLTPKRALSQPEQYLAEERVTLIGPKGTFQNVAVLGPPRGHTQVEISAMDARELGLNPPVALSGELSNAGDMLIASKDAFLMAEKSLIIARNHLHMSPEEASSAGLKDGDLVDIRMETERPLTFNNVIVRSGKAHKLALHIDFDEANACGFQKGCKAYVVGKTFTPCAGQCVNTVEQTVRDCGDYCFEGKYLSEVAVRDLIAKGVRCVTVKPGTVISPLAKDLLNSRKITIKGL